MNITGTNSIVAAFPVAGWCGTAGSRFAMPLLATVLALAGTHDVSDRYNAAPVPPVEPSWTMISNVGGGTARGVIRRANYRQPKTELGKRLLALRQAAIAEGMSLLPVAKIVEELDVFRG